MITNIYLLINQNPTTYSNYQNPFLLIIRYLGTYLAIVFVNWNEYKTCLTWVQRVNRRALKSAVGTTSLLFRTYMWKECRYCKLYHMHRTYINIKPTDLISFGNERNQNVVSSFNPNVFPARNNSDNIPPNIVTRHKHSHCGTDKNFQRLCSKIEVALYSRYASNGPSEKAIDINIIRFWAESSRFFFILRETPFINSEKSLLLRESCT